MKEVGMTAGAINFEMKEVTSEGTYERQPIEARYYQVSVEEALKMQVIDLLKDTDREGHRHLSRVDLILIYTLFKGGLGRVLGTL